MVGIQNDNSYTISALPETNLERKNLKDIMLMNGIDLNNSAYIEQ